jgi:2-amino-4-hydroxy-6-hydroxymethyldihydropteridine diphosphokinase
METKVFIGLGSNIGDGRTILKEAWDALGKMPGVRLDRLSSPYMSAPVDMQSQHWFTNAVGSLYVSLSPLELLKTLMDVESGFGRIRDHGSFGYHDRSLDLDMLYYGHVTMDSPELTIPHPRIGVRLFVLAPFAEIDPDFRDTVTGETIAAMEQRLRAGILAGEHRKQEIICGRWEG